MVVTLGYNDDNVHDDEDNNGSTSNDDKDNSNNGNNTKNIDNDILIQWIAIVSHYSETCIKIKFNDWIV